MRFNFFNYLTLHLNHNGHRGYQRYFHNEYARISSQQQTQPDAAVVTVHIVDRLPDPQDGDIRRTVTVKKLFTFHFLVRDLSSPAVAIYFQRHWLDRVYMNAIAVFLQAQVLEPVMYFKLLESNVLFMHAAGVASTSKGYLFPAHGGTGKTTFSMALLNRGFRLLGDDLLFVALDEHLVYPYARPMHIFTYNVNSLVGARIPLGYRIRIYCKNVLRFFLERLLNTEFLISTRIHADEVFQNNPFGDPVPYEKLFFLRKTGPAVLTVPITEETRPQLAEEIRESADLNDSLYQILENPAGITAVKELERTTINRLLSQFESLTYVNPRRLDLNNLDDFVSDQM